MKFIKKQIEKFDTIIIHGHKRPDGDCYGSQLGLQDMITTTYPHKKVYVINDEEPSISFLGKMNNIHDEIYKEALVFVVDCGQKKVISGDNRYKLGKMIIRIDHHLFIEKIGHYEWIDENFGSCSEMIYSLKEYNNFKLTKKGALAIYTGIVTDTGNFRFERVNSNTFRKVAELLEYDLNIVEIDKKINCKNINVLKFQGYICNNFISEEGFIYFKFSEKIIQNFDLTIDTSFSIVNILSYIQNHLVWAFICELNNGTYKISIRSHGPKISHIANQFGGGGHKRACGLIVNNLNEVNKVIKLIKQSIKEFQHETK